MPGLVGDSGCHIILFLPLLPSLICKPKRSGEKKGRPRVAADSFFAPIRLPFVFLFSSEEGKERDLSPGGWFWMEGRGGGGSTSIQDRRDGGGICKAKGFTARGIRRVSPKDNHTLKIGKRFSLPLLLERCN